MANFGNKFPLPFPEIGWEETNWFNQDILIYFPKEIKEKLNKLTKKEINELEEIRIRVNKPLICQNGAQNYWVNPHGELIPPFKGEPFIVKLETMQKIISLISNNSFYAMESELAQGYLTLPGGHRVGFTGEVVLEGNQIKTLKNITSLNFRIAREIIGVADSLIPFLVEKEKERIYHTLIISPPRAGKTTILRDLIRQFSDGIPNLIPGSSLGLVDERSELAGSYRGVPQKNVGQQTDVLDACPKALGMILLLRSMSPRVIAVDELGREEDVNAVLETINAGVTILATVHGNNLEDFKQRPIMGSLYKNKVFERYIILSRRRGPGTIEGILDKDGIGREVAFTSRGG